MTELKNDRFLRALLRQPSMSPRVDDASAGRYLPEYRATREKAGDFMRLCQTPELPAKSLCNRWRVFPWTRRSYSRTFSPSGCDGTRLYFEEGEGRVSVSRYARRPTSAR